MQPVDQSSTTTTTSSTFTTQELARLAAYRGAVRAGLFTDWDGSADTTDADVLAWLGPARAAASAGGADYPFTAEERARLEALRARLSAGECADDRAAPAAAASATPDDATR